MAKGRVLALGPDSQALLALWASKTGIALITATAPELREIVPIDHRVTVRRNGRPSDEAWVGYFPWGGEPVLNVGAGTADSEKDQTTGPEMYSAIFAFGEVGMFAMGFTDLGPNITISGDQPPLIDFWPLAGRTVTWPPDGPPLKPGPDMAALLRFTPLRKRP